MMLPNLKSYIYLALDENNKEISTVEAKLNVMQATFLVLQISYKNDSIILKAHHVFRVFFDRHFTEAKQASCPVVCIITVDIHTAKAKTRLKETGEAI